MIIVEPRWRIRCIVAPNPGKGPRRLCCGSGLGSRCSLDDQGRQGPVSVNRRQHGRCACAGRDLVRRLSGYCVGTCCENSGCRPGSHRQPSRDAARSESIHWGPARVRKGFRRRRPLHVNLWGWFASWSVSPAVAPLSPQDPRRRVRVTAKAQRCDPSNSSGFRRDDAQNRRQRACC